MANSAVVGTLRAILSADTAEFATAMNKAATSADQAAKDIAKTGQAFQALEPRMASVTRLVKDFSGSFERRSADEFAMAIERVGGAARLSERELSKASAVFGDYISKARAMGQEVPPHIAKVSAEIDKLRDASWKGGSIIGQIGDAFKNLGPSMLAAAGGFITTLVSVEALSQGLKASIAFIKESVVQAAEAEKAQRKLTAALEAQKTATPETVRAYKDLADQFQRTTVFSDELIMEMETLLVQVGNVMPKDMEAALTAVTNLSSGLGIDLRQATMMVAKAAEDNFKALKNQGVVIEDTRVKAEGFAYVLGQVNAKFGGQAAADLNTFDGQLKSISNQFAELQEQIGTVIIKSTAFHIAFAALREEIRRIEFNIQATIAALRLMGELPGPVGQAFKLLVGNLGQASDSLKELESRQAEFFRMKFGANAALPTDWTNYVKVLDDAKKKVNELSPATRKAIAEEIAAREALKKPLDDVAKKYGLTSDMLVVLTTKTKESTKAVKEQTSEYAKWAETVTGAGLLRDLATLETRLERLTKEGGLNRTAMKNIAKEADELGQKLGFLPPKLQTLVNQFIGLGQGIVSTTITVPKFDDALDVSGDEIRDYWKEVDQLRHKFENLNKIINTQKGMQDLFKGGISQKDIIKAQEAIQTFGEKTTKAFLDVGGSFLQLGHAIGGTAGEMIATIGAISQGIGQLASGQYIQGIASLTAAVAKFAKGLTRNLARDAQDAFATTELGFANLNTLMARLREMGPEGINLAAAGDRAQRKDDEEATRKWMADVRKFLDKAEEEARLLGEALSEAFGNAASAAEDFGGKAPAALQPFIQELLTMNGLTKEQRDMLAGLAGAPEWQQLQGIAEKYGIELGSLGKAFQDAKIGDTALQYARDFNTLKEAGGDVNGLLMGMQDEVQKLVKEALIFGTDMPEAMRPVLQGLIDMGQLTDENGDKLENLDRFKFSGAFEDIFKDMKTILEDIRDLLKNGLPDAAKEGAKGVRDQYKDGVEIPVKWKWGNFDPKEMNPPPGYEAPSAQTGAMVAKTGLVNVHAGEIIAPLDELDLGREVRIDNRLYLDGREVTVAVVQHMRETARRLGVRPI